ncbi:MAG TPA: aminotransferase class I/II-fold pyridoxal phosphate-dependent enzyme [Actinomycetota bacterium]
MTAFPLEPDAGQMEAMARAATAYVVGHLEGLPDAPAADLDGADDLAATFRDSPPEEPRAFEELLTRIAPAVDKSFNTAGPGYLAFIPGGGLYSSALATFVAGAVNRYTALWAPAPALAQIEWSVVRWMADLFGYPPEARGVLTSGGSTANLSALVTARQAVLGDRIADGALYVTERTHASVAKAARIAGMPPAAVRTVPTDTALRMDAEALRLMIAKDRESGVRPFCVVASAGSTDTGSIDPLRPIRALTRDEGMWMHADAAYGGFFQLTERGRRAFDGIAEADSITLDPHKGLFLPYGTGALLVRDGEAMRRAHSESAAHYLRDLATGEHAVNFADYSTELSRDNRGLRMWIPLHLHGVRAFREALDEKLDLTRLLYDELRAIPDIEVPWEPELTIVAFRARAGDDASHALLERINASKRVFLSSTVLDGRTTLRACIVSHRTHRDRIEEAAQIIRDAVAGVPGRP